MNEELCPFCDNPATLTSNEYGSPQYVCVPCDEGWYTPDQFDAALRVLREVDNE